MDECSINEERLILGVEKIALKYFPNLSEEKSRSFAIGVINALEFLESLD
jgi:hypothetical protein